MNGSERRINLYDLSHEMLLALTLLEEKSDLLLDESLVESDRQVLATFRELGAYILNQYHGPNVLESKDEVTTANGAVVELTEETCHKLADFLQVNVQRLFLVSPDSVGHVIFSEASAAESRQEELHFQPFDLFSLTFEQLQKLLVISKEYVELETQVVIVEQCLRVLRSPDRGKIMRELSKIGKRTGYIPKKDLAQLQLSQEQRVETQYSEGSIGQSYQLKKRRGSQ